ncbi:uncharacterized protein LOC111258188 [Setaria italica]|nr:uncharacterized protein LOC111258188 [Setaria italica]
MVGSVRRERRRKGEESGPRKMGTSFRPGGFSFTGYVYLLTYLLMAITGLGYLALTWSTVVLLGGFVTSLQRKDFWCLTVISMLQAARIFNDLGDQLVTKFFNLLIAFNRRAVSVAREWLAFQTIDGKPIPRKKIGNWLRILIVIYVVVVYIPLLPLLAGCYIVVFLYGYGGPIVCIGLALWRIVQRDYGSNDGDDTKANLTPALDLFYCLILCQGVLYMTWLWSHPPGGAFIIVTSRQDYNLPRKWGYIWLVDYLFDTRAKCWQDPASIQGSTMSRYAVDLIDSESWDDNLSGLRMLATFIRQEADVRSLLLPSRARIQKLINTLGWRASASREMREAAGCIVAHLASDIHLAQFPGAIRCISTLLQDEATLTYWWNCDQKQDHTHLRTGSRSTMHTWINILEKIMPKAREQEVNRQGDDDDDRQHKKHVVDVKGGGCNELILQGLTILERLASDQHNCMDICRNPSLLPRIMAPLCSNTLIQGAKTSAWADVVNGSFKVLYRLIRCPGWTGKCLRRDIATSEQGISNLESILDQSNEAGQELQMRAMEILTELALDSSTNLTMETKENLMKKQLEIFLDEESAAISKDLKATAGRTLTFLITNSKVNCSVVKDYFGHLTELLDAKNNTTYRMIAAQVLENICAHCDLDKECVKDTLLPQILTGIQSNKREPPEGADDQGDDEKTETKELQENFLSLTLVIYDNLISIDDFDDAIQKNGLGNGEFVVKLKTIVEENCKETVISLRIVKLCGQIAATMMMRSQYTEHFKNQGFAESLSKAKKIMSNLESCVLFAGTELRLKKIATPLLSEIEKELN